MAQAVTVTCNTGIDHVLEVDRLDVGGVTRATGARFYASGKGVNVARALEALGKPVTAVGFAAADFALAAVAAPLAGPSRFRIVPGNSRLNTTIQDRATCLSTHVVGRGYRLPAGESELLARDLDELVTKADVLCLSGSLPDGAPPDTYARLLHSRARFRLLDATDEPFLRALAAMPDCVKPNLDELGRAVGRHVDDTDDAVTRAARTLLELGARRVVVSRGPRGIIAVSAAESAALKASVELGPIDRPNPIGAGDALVAGILAATLDGLQWPETLALGVACGAANVLGSGPGAIALPEVRRLEALVTIRTLHY